MFAMSLAMTVSVTFSVWDVDYLLWVFWTFMASKKALKAQQALVASGNLHLHHLVAWTSTSFIVSHQDRSNGSEVSAARLGRRCDFARLRVFIVKGIWEGLQRLECYMLVGSYGHTIRRLLTRVGQRVHIVSRLLGWDKRSFVFQHVFLVATKLDLGASTDSHDDKLFAVNLQRLASLEDRGGGESVLPSRPALSRALQRGYDDLQRVALTNGAVVVGELNARLHVTKSADGTVRTPYDVLVAAGYSGVVPTEGALPDATQEWIQCVESSGRRLIGKL